MRKTGGGGLSANFANSREFFGRGILTADDADFRGVEEATTSPTLLRAALQRAVNVTNAEQTQREGRTGA
jgi:hypothetical protein